jgi:hypothetical protein
MNGLGREQLIEVGVLVAGLVVSFAVMSAHHPYTSTILSMAAALVVAAHIVVVARR